MTSGVAAPEAGKLIEDLGRLSDEFSTEIGALATEQDIRLAQARFLGRKGRVTELMKALGRIPAAERPRVGEAANRARDLIESAVSVRLRALQEQTLQIELARSEDVTLPARGDLPGTLHPLTLVRREV
jgi:phenylalanyl-tRNA synthetase alpha chain